MYAPGWRDINLHTTSVPDFEASMNTITGIWTHFRRLLKRDPVKTTSSGTFEFREFTEADQPLYDSFKLKNPLNTFRYPSYWVVDKKRRAELVSFGGCGDLPEEYGEPPNFYTLVWKGQVIDIETYKKFSGHKGLNTYAFHVSRISLSKKLFPYEHEVLLLIREALFENQRGLILPNSLLAISFYIPQPDYF